MKQLKVGDRVQIDLSTMTIIRRYYPYGIKEVVFTIVDRNYDVESNLLYTIHDGHQVFQIGHALLHDNFSTNHRAKVLLDREY